MHKIYIFAVKAGKRGLLYDAEFEGERICQSTLTPFLDGCRVLKGRGLTGPVEMWDPVRPYPRMKGTIEMAAGLTVLDNSSGTPKFGKYVPYERRATQDGDLD